jgi:ribose-phosphate pyrophosphokinase
MTSIVVPMPGNREIAGLLAAEIGAETGELLVRHFPDGESYLRYETPVEGKSVVLVATLDRPDAKILPLIFAAGTAMDLGASRVGLVAPYLAYMRQDKRFKSGESVSSVHFAKTVSPWIDWLVTVDPHLHRRSSLDEIYSVPSAVVRAAPLVSNWIRESVPRPLLIGPDSESEQWVAAVAADAEAPFVILEKTRRGDRDVEVSVPEVDKWRGRTPVLVDDIISTARTMIETVEHVRAAGLNAPVCVGIHAVFADGAYAELKQAGAGEIVSSNTISHDSNRIDVSSLIVSAIRRICPD